MFALEYIQDKLNFDSSVTPHFITESGAGRHGVAGLLLGVIFGFHACIILLQGYLDPEKVGLIQWSVYMCLFCFFHASEWYITAVYRPSELGYKSWLINHSMQYTIAQIASCIEFWVEFFFLPFWLKSNRILITLTFCFSSIAICIRISGMVTAGGNFDHIVMMRKKENHQLVTNGIYSWLRHPAYFGWYYWVVCSQMLLGNPICTLGFAYVTTVFFNGRIPPEEQALVNIYGETYFNYCRNTPIGIPLVRGFVPYDKNAPISTSASTSNKDVDGDNSPKEA
uniref:Protein-S-isoprenylcysteine O-methyltransferase n=2 Tax=Aplanochytrium stocchinoi TaxID=215587 RepID=A0A7S3V2F3_9STRA|mmetsp:Transcript_3406/g.3930  ORF Transcript_3406/g.3930 Transcript_3406/m.3930 type:complete len:282 (+) Transcript_3406:82-927(+)